MVLRLADCLGVPLRERNSLLVAAGYAPVYRESALDDQALAPVRRALELVLDSHEPFPAFVLDPLWNVVLANEAQGRILRLLLPEDATIEPPVNVLRLVFDPELIRPKVLNWELVAQVLAGQVRKQLRTPAMTGEQRETLRRLLDYPGINEATQRVPPAPESTVVLPLELEISGQRTSWFSTIATLGTPLDITAEEIRIESMFPADETTHRTARELGSDG